MTHTFMMLLLKSSCQASIAVIMVMIVRLILKNAPKKWSYMLWSVVIFRCLCPVSIETDISIYNAVPTKGQAAVISVPYVTYSDNPLSEKLTENTPMPADTAAFNRITAGDVLFAVWLAGITITAVYTIISFIRLKLKVDNAVLTDGIYQSDRISTAFALGILRPKIYLPCGLSDKEKELIVMHEKVHIKRGDCIIKPVMLAALCIHWFNPLIWAAFALMSKDMELSCDEEVIRQCGERKEYSRALLKISMQRSGLTLPISFGESSIKERVSNVLKFKKPAMISTMTAAVLLTASCAAVGTNARSIPDDETPTQTQQTEYSDEEIKRKLEEELYNKQKAEEEHYKAKNTLELTQLREEIEKAREELTRLEEMKSQQMEAENEHNSRINFTAPVEGQFTCNLSWFFSDDSDKPHSGIDYSIPTSTNVIASADGTVSFAGKTENGYGTLITITHENGFETRYAHLSEVLAEEGDTVCAGDIIGKSGSSGMIYGEGLHFELIKDGNAVDPANYFTVQ